jgi:hypothetical protein
MKNSRLEKPFQDTENLLFDVSGGGLISILLRRFNLPLLRWQQAVALLCIAWLPLAVMTIVDGTFYKGVSMPFITDYSRQGRLLLGVPLMILIHDLVYERMPVVLEYMANVMMTPEDRERFIQGPLRKAKRRNNAMWMQVILLLIIAGVALSPMGGARFLDVNAAADSWIVSTHQGPGVLSMAGKWMEYVSIPVFQFLVFRWLWRYATWVVLVYRISRFQLKLRPTHPDGAGGLGILILAQRGFSFVFFVCGMVISSNMVALFTQHQVSFDVVKLEILAFVLLSLIMIFSPLLFFTRRLIWAKYLGHLYLGKAGVNASERFEDEWVSQLSAGKTKPEGVVDASDQADFTNVYRYLQDLSVVPFRMGDLIQISLVLFLPFIPVFFMHYSVAELLEKIVGVLL